MNKKYLLSLILIPSLNGCVAIPLVGGGLAGEVATDRMLTEEKFVGDDLLQLANWNEAIKKTTKSLSGKEEWVCADMNREVRQQMDINNSYQLVCISEGDKPVQQQTYICKDGKGGMVSALINKGTVTTYWCENINNTKS